MRTLAVVGVVLLLLLLVALSPLSLFSVDRAEFVYLTQFGRHIDTYDGAADDQAGLHVKLPWPIQTVTRVDRRLQYLDLPPAELVTADPQGGSIDRTLSVEVYVCWRIPDAQAVENYIKTVGTTERARETLRDRVRSRLGAEIAQMKLEQLINAERDGQEAADVHRNWDDLRERLIRACQRGGSAAQGVDDGIEIVDIRLRRLNYPPQVREAIYDRIISERNKKVAYYQSEGRRQAEEIRARSEAEVSRIRTRAEAESSELRGAADANADRIRLAAFLKDPDYYGELKGQQIGLDTLDPRTKVWSSSLWDLYFPRPNAMSYPRPKKPAVAPQEKAP